jgi:hypothetical protein
MKRVLLLMGILSVTLPTLAQEITTPQTSSPSASEAISQGNWLIGSTIGGTNFNFETNTFAINVQPRAGYFVSERVAVGALATLGFVTEKEGDDVFSYGIAPFARYYFPEGASATGRWFGEVSAGIAGSSGGVTNPVSLTLGASAGYAHFISRTVALEGILGYTYNEADIDVEGSGSSGLALSVGFQVYLPGRRR